MRKIRSFILVFCIVFWAISLNAFAEETTELNNWANYGEAYYDSDEKAYVLTNNERWKNGSIWCVTPYYKDFTLEFDYYTGIDDVTYKNGADGIAVAFYSDHNYKMGLGEELGFNGSKGYGIELDTYCNSGQSDPDYNHISLIKETVGNHLITERLDESEDDEWHHLKVEVKDYHCAVYVDNNLKFNYDVESTGYGWIGITSATGDWKNKHAVKNISIAGEEDYEKQLLELRLSHELMKDCYKEEGSNQEYYEYKISAIAKNGMTMTAEAVTLVFETADESVLISEETPKEVSIGNLATEEEIEEEWTIYIPKSEENVMQEYNVTLHIEDIVSFKQSGRILIEPKNEYDNTIIFGEDQWNFENDYKYFNPKGNENYYMTNNDYQALVHNISNIDKFIRQEPKKIMAWFLLWHVGCKHFCKNGSC